MNRDELPTSCVVLAKSYFDEAIVGIDQKDKVIYDYDLLVQALMKYDEGCSLEDALEYLDSNIVNSDKIVILYRC